MKNLLLKIAWLGAAMSLGTTMGGALAHAQTVSVTTVTPVPDGCFFLVDGQIYNHATTFTWTTGSVHTLAVTSPNQTGVIAGGIYTFTGFTFAGGSFTGDFATITADPSVTRYLVNFSVQFSLTINLYNCGSTSCTGGPGYVLVNGSAITGTQTIWISGSTPTTLQAYPYPGYVFTGWQPGYNQAITGFQDIVTMAAPMSVTATFSVARTIDFATVPANLNIYTDGNITDTPVALQWGWNTTHTVAPESPQIDRYGNRWIFSSWSDGGASTHSYTVAATEAPASLTATYVPGVQVSFLTLPGGLSLTVDNRSNNILYNFLWGVGETHTISAPAQQTDAQGNVWKFASWSNGGAQTQQLTMTSAEATTGLRLTATYTPVGQVTINSPVAPFVTVAGASCPTPCTLTGAVGSTVQVSAPPTVPVNAVSRQSFLAWSNGATGDLTATLSASPNTIAANYHLMNYLATGSSPAGGVSWTMSPASPDNFYDAAATVGVSASVLPGFKFQSFTGDLSGTIPDGHVAMNVPRTVEAVLTKIPYLSPGGVVNAAGPTPVIAIAPGSLVAVYGLNLTPDTILGPATQLAQTLDGITASAGGRLLPLFFVSPGQINLQLPADFPLGPATLTLEGNGQAPTTATFTVVQDAPGLFTQSVSGQAMAIAIHADGTLVTTASPAVAGETLLLYGTGFGPTNVARPEGLPAPPGLSMLDPITVALTSGQTAVPASVSATFPLPGAIGIDAIQFVVPGGLPTGTAANLTITVNGQASNTAGLSM